jgi:O-antigen/teichoic acid export membrane protein
MLKEFIRNSFVYTLSGIFSSAISLFLIPIYTRIFVPADYGIIELVAILTNLIYLTIALEISQAIGLYTLDTKDTVENRRYFSTALVFTIGVYTLFSIIAVIFSKDFSQYLFDDPGKSYIFIISVISIWSGGIFYLLKEQLRWFSRVSEYTLINITFSIISIIVTLYLVVFLKIGVVGVFYGLTVGNCVGILHVFYYLKNDFRLVFDFRKLQEMLRFSIPLVPSSVGVFVSLFIDRIAINELLSLNDLGLYSIAYRVASVAGLLVSGAQMAITPLIINSFREKDTPQKIAKVFRFFMIGAFCTILIIGLFSRGILILFTTPLYYGASNVIVLIVITLFLSGIYTFAPGLWITKKTKYIALINIFAAVLNVILVYTLIPIFGIIGAALATLISAFIIFLVNQIASQKYYPIQYSWKKLGLTTIIVAGVLFAGLLIPLTVPLLIYFFIKSILGVIGIGLTAIILTENGEIIMVCREASELMRLILHLPTRN